MYYIKYFFGSINSKVTKEILSNIQIPLIDNRNSYQTHEDKILCKCKTGNFYFGKYNGEKAIIKKIDITKDVLILDEFVFWKNMENNNFYLQLIAVDIKYGYAYLIFKDEKLDIEFNLEYILSSQKEKEKLTISNKILIIKQLLSILNYFNENKIIHRGLRPGIIGLDKEYNMRLMDYGELIDLNTTSEKEIIEELNKYIPPEYIKDNLIHETFDIYSFGKILKNLVTNEEILNENIENISDNNNINKNINPIIMNIIQRCTEEDMNKRIKFDELNYNMELVINEYYINNQYSDCTIEDFNLNYLKENNEINEYYQFGKRIEDRLDIVIPDLRGNLENKIKQLKLDIINNSDNIYSELDSIKKNIINKTNKYIQSSKDIIKTFYDKLFASSLYMQSTQLSDSTNDIYDIALKTKGILKDISVLSKLNNPSEYNFFKLNIETTRNEIDELVKKNSIEEDFDLVYKIYETQYNNYQKYCELIQEIKDSFKNLKDILDKSIETNNIKMNKVLAMDFNIGTIKENSEYFKSMNDNIYAKIKENSNLIYIYNYFTKSISSHEIKNDILFNSKCFSFFDKEENCIYVSGGCPHNDISNVDNSFYKISIKFVPKQENKNKISQNYNIFDFGEYNFTIKNLSPLLNSRYSHCMIRSLKEKSIFINVGGKNTKTAEVYNIEKDKAVNIHDLPTLCPNPACYEINDNIYLFGNSEFDLSCVYYLDDKFNWIEMDYKMEIGSLKKGMNIINCNNSFYLFGGYDNSREFSDIYKLNFNGENLNIDFCQNLALSHNCYFNSNAIVIEKKNENEEKKEIVLMMDATDNIEEIELNNEKI